MNRKRHKKGTRKWKRITEQIINKNWRKNMAKKRSTITKGPVDKISTVKFVAESDDLGLTKANKDDTGYDIKAKIEVIIPSGEFRTITTGIRLQIPKGVDHVQVRPRLKSLVSQC